LICWNGFATSRASRGSRGVRFNRGEPLQIDAFCENISAGSANPEAIEEDLMSKRLNAVITKEEKWYVARCVELGVVSQGKTIEEAKANLKEAVELYLESFGS